LDAFAADVVASFVPLSLDVDPVKAQSILVNDTVEALVAGSADPFAALLGAFVTHR
jgi:hypothetical protein